MPETRPLFFWIFASLYSIHFLVEIGLDVLNLRELKKHRNSIPELFRNTFSLQDYQKSIRYTQAQTYFGWVKGAVEALLLWGMILSGAFFSLAQTLQHLWPDTSLLFKVLYPFCIGGIFYLVGLPFTLFHTFVIEERYGFNRMNLSTFVLDQIKTLLLTLLLGAPLLALLFILVESMGAAWWLWGWLTLLGFQFLVAALFPVLLAPLFYRFTPLEAGELQEKIYNLAQKVHFKMAGVFTIDGSRRSSHSNAFFAGMGKARRIVLFDTLRQQLSIGEILAVLAHEMGHNVKKHIQKGLLLSACSTLVGFYLLHLCLNWPPFYQSFGVPHPDVAIGFVLFALLGGVWTFPLTPLKNALSRHNEYESDRFSAEVTQDPTSMASALLKLSKDNLSNLTPHPWYSFYHYSHPTSAERIRALGLTNLPEQSKTTL